jgi:hypothetical protein
VWRKESGRFIGTVLTAVTLGVEAGNASGPTAALIAAQEVAADVAAESTVTGGFRPRAGRRHIRDLGDWAATVTPIFEEYIADTSMLYVFKLIRESVLCSLSGRQPTKRDHPHRGV